MKLADVRLRAPEPSDINFIISSWLKSNRNSDLTNFVNNETYYSVHSQIITRLINKSLVSIICNATDPNHLYGYVVYENLNNKLVVHYIYVKYTYRNFGIAKMVLNTIFDNLGKEEIYLSHIDRTNISEEGKRSSCFIKKRDKYKLVYNPYLIA